jgi:hypothetical protein
VIRAPAPAFQPLPVLASRLPRIEWSHDDQQPAPSASAALAPSAPTPALIVAVQEDNSVSPAMPTTTVPSGTPTVESDAATPDAATRAGASVASGDPPPARDDARQEPKVAEATVGTPDAPGLIPRGWRHTDATTRPLPAITRPLPTPTGARSGARSGGLWGRVSQALVGQAATDAETIADTKPEQAPVADEVTPVADDVAPEDAWLNG